MNSTKNKLFAAIAMLIVAAVAMTGTSFAWFTISTAPRVDNLDVSMAATHNFEIAAVSGTTLPTEPYPGDSPDETKWGATVSFASSSALVFPMTYTGGALKSIYYDTTGRVVDYKAPALSTFNTSGVAYYYANISGSAVSTADPSVAGNVTVGAVYGVYLRANQTINCGVSIGAFDVYQGNGTTKISTELEDVTADDVTRLTSAVAVSVKFQELTNTGTNVGEAKTITAGATTSLTANKIYRAEVTVYFDGEYIYAKDIANGLKVNNFDIEFINKDTGVSMGTNQGGTYTPLMNF